MAQTYAVFAAERFVRNRETDERKSGAGYAAVFRSDVSPPSAAQARGNARGGLRRGA
ncbi:MAG: hypothetical protein LBS62_00385 [Clostridiales bacterium]|jgi:hypothetical protein|nr:hypothetical protein [Clostridiales bacterium]